MSTTTELSLSRLREEFAGKVILPGNRDYGGARETGPAGLVRACKRLVHLSISKPKETTMPSIPRHPIATKALAPAALAAMFAAAPAWAGTEAFTDRLVFTDDVSMTLTQELEGLDSHEVDIDNASHLWIAEFTIEPGTVFPWHTHPAVVVMGVTEGDFVFVLAEDCVRRAYTSGEALVDPGDRIHTAYNPSDTSETVIVAAYLGAPADGDLTLPVPADEAGELDAQCDLETPGEHTR